MTNKELKWCKNKNEDMSESSITWGFIMPMLNCVMGEQVRSSEFTEKKLYLADSPCQPGLSNSDKWH